MKKKLKNYKKKKKSKENFQKNYFFYRINKFFKNIFLNI